MSPGSSPSERGENAPQGAGRTLVFLPGAAGDPVFWRSLGDRLPEHWEKRYLRWPGLGNQPRSPSIAGFDDLVSLTESQLGSHPVDLLAQSMGGAVALRVALRHPDKIRRLVLAATSGGLDVAALGAADWREEYRREYPNAAEWITSVRPNYEMDLSRIQAPVLLLWGEADPISPLAIGRRLSELLPQSRLCTVPGGDHGFVHTRAEAVLDRVIEHLR